MVIEVTFDTTDVYISTTVSPVYVNVSFEAPGGNGGAAWGDITGTLSDQTDLQTALNGKFDDPTGTTSQYLRGDGSLATFPAIPSGTVTSVGLSMPSAFSVANSPITTSGTLAVTATGDTTQYIAGDGSLVAFPITGQAGTLVREVRNVTGATLTKGTVVYINGASGNKPTVAKALATGDATSAQTFGLIQADIPNNSNGYLVAFGDLDGLNTSSFAEGVQLYLSSTTAGGYTSTKQYAPNHLVYIGVVTRQHVNQGRIEVRIQNGYELDELHDVAAQTPSNNDGIFYNSTNSLWENKSIATALGYTPANSATTLTINGVTFDLSTSRTFTVGSVTGSGASGQVAYWTGTSAQAGSNNLFWDNTNSRLGIGTNAPSESLTIQFNNSSSSILGSYIKNTNTAGRTGAGYYNDSNEGGVFGTYGSAFGISSYRNNFGIVATKSLIFLTDGNTVSGGSSSMSFITGGYNVAAAMTLTSAGRLLLGSSSDTGERLQVQGTTLLNGNVTFSSATGMFWDATNSRLGIGTNAPETALNIIYNNNTYSNGIIIRNTNTGTTSMTGVALKDSANQFVGQFSYIPSNYITTSLRNTIIFTSSGLQKLAFIANAGAVSSTPQDIYFQTLADKNNMYLYGATGNLVLQNGGTFTDSGERLQVQGTTLLNGNVTFTDTSGMFWNASTSRLGLGIGAPAEKLHVVGNARFAGTFHYFELRPSAWSGYFYLQAGVTETAASAGNYTAFLNTETNRGFSWVQGTGAGTAKMVLTPTTFNLLIGSTTDSGERLQVTGNVLVTGQINLTNNLKFGSQDTLIYATANGSTLSAAGRGLIISTNATSQSGVGALKILGNYSSAVGNDYGIWISHTFTNGTGGIATHSGLLLNQTINQTGGANGITRGLYVNPTLTAAADFRAIETTNGKVIFGNLPTSSAGLPTGAIWNDAGTIKIV